jgi:hypothetical protein
MKLITQKPPFCSDFSITKGINSASISSISRCLLVILSIFFSVLLFNSNSLAIDKNSQQVPTKKSTPASTKSTSPSKIVKSKKGSKSKKSIVVKKDTLRDIDPATANSPLYNN